MSVEITRVQVYANGDGKNTLGYAHITLGNTFVVKNLRVVRGKKGVFVGMPSNKTRKGEFIDIFFPINQQAREYLTRTIIEAFRKEFPDVMKGLEMYSTPDNQ